MSAILAIWQPGTRGGQAVADILLGRRDPRAGSVLPFREPRARYPCFTTCVRGAGGVTKASIKTSPPARFMTSDTD